MKQYLDLINHILTNGTEREDRTGVGTMGIFGHQMRFDLSDGFPLLTTKRLHIRSIIFELLWLMNGDTNIKYLNDNGVHIWDSWSNEDGDLGPIYGRQFRSWETSEGLKIDQIQHLIWEIKNNPNSRRQIVSAWNVGDLPYMALPPCHCLFQTYVSNGKLNLQLYQRSADVFLGLPFNIASYSLLLTMFAQQCDLEPGEFIWTGGDVHIYRNHIDQVKLQIMRDPYPLPKLILTRRPPSIDKYELKDFVIVGYNFHPHIHGDVAV